MLPIRQHKLIWIYQNFPRPVHSMAILSQLNWPLNIFLGARWQNIWIQERPQGLKKKKVEVYNCSVCGLNTPSQPLHREKFPGIIIIVISFNCWINTSDFHLPEFLEKAMCTHPLNYIKGSLKSALLSFLWLIFMSKWIFQTLDSLEKTLMLEKIESRRRRG